MYPVIMVSGPFCSEATIRPRFRVMMLVTSPTHWAGTETPILYTGSRITGSAVRNEPRNPRRVAGMICAGPRCTGSSCNRASMSLTFNPRIGSSQRGPFSQAHRNPEMTMSRTSRRYWIPFVKSTRMFLCISSAQTFLASSVGHAASSRKTVPMRFRPISSMRSPRSIILMTCSSRGCTWIQNRLCLFGLLAMATTPCPVMPSR